MSWVHRELQAEEVRLAEESAGLHFAKAPRHGPAAPNRLTFKKAKVKPARFAPGFEDPGVLVPAIARRDGPEIRAAFESGLELVVDNSGAEDETPAPLLPPEAPSPDARTNAPARLARSPLFAKAPDRELLGTPLGEHLREALGSPPAPPATGPQQVGDMARAAFGSHWGLTGAQQQGPQCEPSARFSLRNPYTEKAHSQALELRTRLSKLFDVRARAMAGEFAPWNLAVWLTVLRWAPSTPSEIRTPWYRTEAADRAQGLPRYSASLLRAEARRSKRVAEQLGGAVQRERVYGDGFRKLEDLEAELDEELGQVELEHRRVGLRRDIAARLTEAASMEKLGFASTASRLRREAGRLDKEAEAIPLPDESESKLRRRASRLRRKVDELRTATGYVATGDDAIGLEHQADALLVEAAELEQRAEEAAQWRGFHQWRGRARRVEVCDTLECLLDEYGNQVVAPTRWEKRPGVGGTFEWVPVVDLEDLDGASPRPLVNRQRCELEWCPTCSRRRAARRVQRLQKRLALEFHDARQMSLVTLTCRSIEGGSLEESLWRIETALAELRDDAKRLRWRPALTKTGKLASYQGEVIDRRVRNGIAEILVDARRYTFWDQVDAGIVRVEVTRSTPELREKKAAALQEKLDFARRVMDVRRVYELQDQLHGVLHQRTPDGEGWDERTGIHWHVHVHMVCRSVEATRAAFCPGVPGREIGVPGRPVKGRPSTTDRPVSFLDKQALVDDWRKLLEEKGLAIGENDGYVDVRQSTSGGHGGLLEVAKYAAKAADLSGTTDEDLYEWVTTMAGRRTLRTWGQWYGDASMSSALEGDEPTEAERVLDGDDDDAAPPDRHVGIVSDGSGGYRPVTRSQIVHSDSSEHQEVARYMMALWWEEEDARATSSKVCSKRRQAEKKRRGRPRGPPRGGAGNGGRKATESQGMERSGLRGP